MQFGLRQCFCYTFCKIRCNEPVAFPHDNAYGTSILRNDIVSVEVLCCMEVSAAEFRAPDLDQVRNIVRIKSLETDLAGTGIRFGIYRRCQKSETAILDFNASLSVCVNAAAGPPPAP